MTSISSTSSSLYSILTSYYTSSTTTDDTTTDTDSTEESETLDQEEIDAVTVSLTQGLVDALSTMSGISTDDDSDSMSWLYNAIEMQQNFDSITDALMEYYTNATEETEETTETDETAADTDDESATTETDTTSESDTDTGSSSIDITV